MVAFQQVTAESVSPDVAVVTAQVKVNKLDASGKLVDGPRRFWLTVEGGQWRLANSLGTEAPLP